MATPDNNSKEYKKALQQLDNMLKKQEALKKSTESLQSTWSAVASEIFKMDGAQFFTNVKKGKDELEQMANEVKDLQQEYKFLGNEFEAMINKSTDGFVALQGELSKLGDMQKNNFKLIEANDRASLSLHGKLSDNLKERIKLEGSIEQVLGNKNNLTQKEIESLEKIKKLNDDNKKYQLESEDFNKNMQDALDELIQKKVEIGLIDKSTSLEMMKQISNGKTIAELMEKATPEGMKFLALLGDETEETKRIAEGMQNITEQIRMTQEESKKMNKEFSMSKGIMGALGSAASGLGSIIKKDWISSMMKFDEVLNDVQKQTGVNMDASSDGFARLQTEVAQFGMDVEGAGKMISNMSNELNTTNFSILAKATKDFAAIEGATGAASEDITTMAGHMMRMGSSSEDVKDSFQNISDVSKKFGISAKGVISDVSKNLGKWKNAGFQGGVESLTKMAAVAKRLNMSIDAAFDMSEKARNIEGAMTMAADLQLAGGSFSNINPMDLLAAARKGPAEMQKILGTMGKDIGKFNEKNEFEIDPVDSDRLRIVAEATGVSLEDLRNGIEKTALDGQKLAGMSEDVFSSAAKGVEGWDADMAKSSLADMMERTKDGKIIMKTDSVDLFKQAGITDLENINETQMAELLKLKDKEKKTIEDENKRNQSLKQSFDNFINAFMSIFSVFEPVLVGLTTAIQFVTKIFTAFMGALDELGPFGTVIKWAIGALVLFGTSFGASVMTFVGKGLASAVSGEGGGVLGKVKNSIVGRFKKSSPVNEDEGITESAKGMDMAKTWDGIKNSISKVADGIKGSIGSIFAFIKDISGQILTFIGDIIGQILNLATRIVDGFTTVLQSASRAIGVVQEIVGKLVSIVTKTFISLMTALGEGITAFASAAAVGLGILTPFIPIIIVLTIAIIGLAFAFKLFAEGLGALAPLITSVFNGIATVVLAVGTAVSMIISTIADSILKLSQIDAGSLFALAAGLGVLSIAMVAFGAAAMIGGVMSFFGGGMFSQLSELALIAPAIQLLANSLNSAGDGLAKLSAAADTLSLEKLEKLKELSDSMANAGAGGAAMAAMANSTGGGGGKGGDGDTRKIEISFKMNGRDIQHTVNSDTSLIK